MWCNYDWIISLSYETLILATSSTYVATRPQKQLGSHGQAHRFILGKKATSRGAHKTHHNIYMMYKPIS